MLPARLSALDVYRLPGGLAVFVARSLSARLVGLALVGDIPVACALLLPRCRSVHTVGMRFPLDLIFLDRGGSPLRVASEVGPWRVEACRGARAVLETRAGEAERFLRAGAGLVCA